MKEITKILICLLLTLKSPFLAATEDLRQFLELLEMTQKHMMSNMRDHLKAIIVFRRPLIC